jgi:hypothetical protein
MFTDNPFAELAASIPPSAIQTYVVLMILLVLAGTLFDVLHKKSAKYFFENLKKSKSKGSKQLGGGDVVTLALRTAGSEVLTSSEFCNPRRRVAHLLTMYGFLAYVVTTVIMVFGYPTSATPAPSIWPVLWHLGALMACVGGYWFWFFIRVDVVAEGNSPFRIVRADLFILSLLASATLALIWSFSQSKSIFGLYAIATTVLFAGIPWSKFAHMFFKPAAALQKRIAEADGSRSNLPAPVDKPEEFGTVDRLPQNY